MRNVCSSKGHLRTLRFSLRERVDTLHFRSQVGISAVLLLCSRFLESVGVASVQIPRGGAGLSQQVLGFLGLQTLPAPRTLSLAYEAPLCIERK